jgi:hypothetical protein
VASDSRAELEALSAEGFEIKAVVEAKYTPAVLQGADIYQTVYLQKQTGAL